MKNRKWLKWLGLGAIAGVGIWLLTKGKPVEEGTLAQVSFNVTDSTTGLPVADASITINGNQVATDATGACSLTVSPKPYIMRVVKTGYSTVERAITVITYGLIINIQLSPIDEPPPPEPTFSCPICGETFSNQALLDAHIQTAHPAPPPPPEGGYYLIPWRPTVVANPEGPWSYISITAPIHPVTGGPSWVKVLSAPAPEIRERLKSYYTEQVPPLYEVALGRIAGLEYLLEYPDSPLVCSYCGVTFWLYSEYDLHLKTHAPGSDKGLPAPLYWDAIQGGMYGWPQDCPVRIISVTHIGTTESTGAWWGYVPCRVPVFCIEFEVDADAAKYDWGARIWGRNHMITYQRTGKTWPNGGGAFKDLVEGINSRPGIIEFNYPGEIDQLEPGNWGLEIYVSRPTGIPPLYAETYLAWYDWVNVPNWLEPDLGGSYVWYYFYLYGFPSCADVGAV